MQRSFLWPSVVRTMAVTSLLLATVSARAEVTCEDNGKAITLRCNGVSVLQYHTAVAEPPEGISSIYRRSGFIHPVKTPSGRTITADFPADHAHQHGIFNAWVNTTYQGRKVDFWNQHQKLGNVEHVRVVEAKSGEQSGEFTVELQHVALQSDAEPQPILKEFWTVRCYAPQATGGPVVFDIESRQTCIAEFPLTLKEYHYGGMGFRGTEAWFSADATKPADFELRTSEGLDRLKGNHTRPQWVIAQGMVDGARCGIAIMGHSDNPTHPEPVRLHPYMPYFSFSPCVLGTTEMTPGTEYRRRYRYIVFDGSIDESLLNQQLEQFRTTT